MRLGCSFCTIQRLQALISSLREFEGTRTMTAVGVARPTAQGQATTSVEMPNSSANRKGLLSEGRQSAG